MVSVDCGTRGAYRRGRPEQGSTVVEFSISVTLLLLLLFGIISYGYMLSFKQGMTQAAAEGARAAAVAPSGTATAAATAAVARSVGAFNKTCGSGGLTCTYTLPYATGCAAPTTCIQVQVTYDYKNHPLMPKFPGLGLLMPDTLTSTSIVQVN
jgi:Flp pilus assembly protein TadG